MNNPISSEDKTIINSAERKQIEASDPTRSVWVNASAGTGKTKVLVQGVSLYIKTNPVRLLCKKCDPGFSSSWGNYAGSALVIQLLRFFATTDFGFD